MRNVLKLPRRGGEVSAARAAATVSLQIALNLSHHAHLQQLGRVLALPSNGELGANYVLFLIAWPLCEGYMSELLNQPALQKEARSEAREANCVMGCLVTGF